MYNPYAGNESPGVEKSRAEGAAGFVYWQQKYFDNLETDLKEIKEELRQTENRVSVHIREAMHKIYLNSDQRHREYMNVNARMDELMARVDKKQDELNKWVLRTSIAVLLGVASLVSTGLFGFVKIVEMLGK